MRNQSQSLPIQYNSSFMPPPLSLERIADLLSPFLGDRHLSQTQLDQVSTYVDLLLRWNSKINLTAIRNPEEIITRHFGESFFAAQHLLQISASSSADSSSSQHSNSPVLGEVRALIPNDVRLAARLTTAIDIGSGAGFPGLPMKIFDPDLELTLVESNHKKAAFLREAIRSLRFAGVTVFADRAEQLNRRASITTLRAVERFEAILPIAASCVSSGGRLALLIGGSQFEAAMAAMSGAEFQFGIADSQSGKVSWLEPIPIPLSSNRVLALAHFDLDPAR